MVNTGLRTGIGAMAAKLDLGLQQGDEKEGPGRDGHQARGDGHLDGQQLAA